MSAAPARRSVALAGAPGRVLHDHATALGSDPGIEVVAAVLDGTPGVEAPATLDGIPVARDLEAALALGLDEVVLSTADVSHQALMHSASRALAAGCDVRLLAPRRTMLASRLPVVAVCGVRTGVGKSAVSRLVCRLLLEAGARPALVRHPIPHETPLPAVRRFGSLAELEETHATLEEREECEPFVRLGVEVFSGTDYGEILRAAEAGADAIVWDGGGNDFPFVAPDLLVVVADALRCDSDLRLHPGETLLRMADVVVVNKVDAAPPDAVERVAADVAAVNPTAAIIRTASPVTLGPGPPLANRAVLVVEDGPSLTLGGLPYGAGTVAARQAGADMLVDPRPYAAGPLADVFHAYPRIGSALPAMGYSERQLRELEQTIDAVDCDIVVTGTPIDLSGLIVSRHPMRRATYEVRELDPGVLATWLEPLTGASASSRRSRSASSRTAAAARSTASSTGPVKLSPAANSAPSIP